MEYQALKKFIEEVYCVEYRPERVVPQIHKNTENRKYFIFRPSVPGFGELEFWYDVERKKFVHAIKMNTWEPMCEDTFS